MPEDSTGGMNREPGPQDNHNTSLKEEQAQGMDPDTIQQQHEGVQSPEEWGTSTYMEHGEWDRTQDDISMMGPTQTMHKATMMERMEMETDNEDLMTAKMVKENGYPNMFGAKIPIKTKWNVDKFEQLLGDYPDKMVIDGLRFGWPTGRLPSQPDPTPTFKNHKGATDHPQALKQYIQKEQAKGAILGPFNKIPFHNRVGISPISTRPKKNSQECRVIVDLSFPQGESVNDGMIKNNYLGFETELTFPKTDDLALRIAYLGRGACMFKIDLSRYFRQIPLDPADYSMVGYIVDGELFFDKVLPMGMRNAPLIAQRITDAIRYLHQKAGHFLLNYVDDFLGAEEKEKIQQAFQHLNDLLNTLQVDAAPEKTIPPTTRLEFLGVTFDSEKMTIEVTQDRVQDMLTELNTWNTKTKASRKEVESLIGKLQFASKCIKPGRTFIARLIQWLRGMDRRRKYSIPKEARKDIAWWGKCLEKYNGISIMWLTRVPGPDMVIASDACPKGFGATCGKAYFHGMFPENMRHQNIAHLEMLAVLAALRVWATQLRGLYFWVHVDNEAVATIINTGASRDEFLQKALREMLMIAATNEFMIKSVHIRGVDNRIPDWLSRWTEPEARKKFNEFAKGNSLNKVNIAQNIIELHNNW